MNLKIEPRITFNEAILNCFKKCFVIKGRSRRSEFWNFYILNILLLIISNIIIVKFVNIIHIFIGFISIILCFSFISLISASIRRLHDTEKSGCYLWLSMIPIIGQFYLLMLLIQDSDQKSNKYGPSPKYSFIDSGNVLINNAQIGQINMLQNMQQNINNQNINQNQNIQLNNIPQIINPQIMSGNIPINISNIYRENQQQIPPLLVNENYEPGIYQNI